MPEPCNYQEVLDRGYILGRDFRIALGDANIARCLLVAPHGGGIEPGTSEVLRAVADLGGWAWYEFAGFLRKGNKDALHIKSTQFDEPALLALLPRTKFVLTFHGASETHDQVVYVGGNWEAGRVTMTATINAMTAEHGITAHDAVTEGPAHLRGAEGANLTNRGLRGQGVQLEFSRGSRNLLFPPDSSREARGRRSPRLGALARAIHTSLERLCQEP